MAETRLDAGTAERIEQVHRFARAAIDRAHEGAPADVEAGPAQDHVVAILLALTGTASDLSFVHRGTSAMVLDAALELGHTEDEVRRTLDALTGLLD